MYAQENSLLVIPWSESAEGPLADARGDSTFLSFRAKREISPSCHAERSEASPLGSWDKVGA
jgi:hypothetical protein